MLVDAAARVGDYLADIRVKDQCIMEPAQLVGMKCVACQKTISSIVEGVFCLDCGNPVHRMCMRATVLAEPGICARCGGQKTVVEHDTPTPASQLQPPIDLHAVARGWLVFKLVSSGLILSALACLF